MGRFFRPLLKFFGFVALSLGLSVLLFHVLSRPFQVFGSSMTPTLSHGDFLLVERLWAGRPALNRGDLVVFCPEEESRYYVKRVVAVGGDTVRIGGGSVRVNGRRIALPSGSVPELAGPDESWVVPSGCFFCLGDNLPASRDSRAFGPVPAERAFGRVLLCYLPPSHWKWLASGGGAR